MSRNYGIGTRDIAHAGRMLLAAAAARGDCAFATVDVVSDRWQLFTQYAKGQGIGRMERVTPALVCGYGTRLAERVRSGEMSPAYAQNLVSAVNTVMRLVCAWRAVSPTKDCAIPFRTTVRKQMPASLDQTVFQAAVLDMQHRGLARQAAVASLARALGLRSMEASLLDARAALQQAQTYGCVHVVDGTKGGRARKVPVGQDRQHMALVTAAALQDGCQSMVPGRLTWIQWRNGGLRDGREILKRHGMTGYHDLRAAYACDRYEVLTRHAAPVCRQSLRPEDVDDLVARQAISQELGHDRVAVVAAYIGAR
ncbi:integrase domain-containing protein [Castellaniella ginsengisoli]|uniref:Integrase domain-containing protein n=1 Tax=Castellaniella ginsengisoli TaxID=546114 RepID=A0AB39CYR9_9BURK